MSIVEKLSPLPTLDEKSTPAPPDRRKRESLTDEEQSLHNRVSTFAGPAFQRHGVNLDSRTLRWIAAEIADFILSLPEEELDQVKEEQVQVVEARKAKK